MPDLAEVDQLIDVLHGGTASGDDAAVDATAGGRWLVDPFDVQERMIFWSSWRRSIASSDSRRIGAPRSSSCRPMPSTRAVARRGAYTTLLMKPIDLRKAAQEIHALLNIE